MFRNPAAIQFYFLQSIPIVAGLQDVVGNLKKKKCVFNFFEILPDSHAMGF